jgi:DNA invertase Pin-like site-specific DNA recombinase
VTGNQIADYFAALDRLKRRHEKINNDAVAIEAGRTKGSIKKSRPVFAELIAAIDAAASKQAHPRTDHVARLNRLKETVSELRLQLDASYARELSLLAEIYELRKQVANLTGGKVLPIRGADRNVRSSDT